MSDIPEAIALAKLLLDIGERIYRTIITGSASDEEARAIRRVLGAELAAVLAKRAADAKAHRTLGT